MSQSQGFGRIAEREQGLKRRLSSGQMSMIAIGGPSAPACSWAASSPSASPAPAC